jgi:hypothetical protein
MFEPQQAPRDSVRLSDIERRALLNSVTKRANSAPDAIRRSDTRFALPPGYKVVGEIKPPGSPSQKILVTMRDISRMGMAMLHGGYVYEGTQVRIVIVTTTNEPVCEVTGKVVRCVHVKGHIHDIGVRFDSPLPIEALLQVAEIAGDDKSAVCKYPALLALLEDMVNIVRSGGELNMIQSMLDEVHEAVHNTASGTEPVAAPAPSAAASQPAVPAKPAAPKPVATKPAVSKPAVAAPVATKKAA